MFRGILAALVLLSLASCSNDSKESSSRPAVSIYYSEVFLQDVPVYIEAIGVFKPYHYVEVKPQVSGLIEEVLFKEGQLVAKDQPLFRIESKAYTIQLKEAQALMLQHEASLTLASQKYERMNLLKEKDLVSTQDVEELKAQVSQFEAQIRFDKAKIAQAKLNLKKCEITSPIRAKAGKLLVHSGNLVASQSSSLVALSDVSKLYVDFFITERDFYQLSQTKGKEGLVIEVASLIRPEDTVQAKLSFVDSGFDSQTGLMHFRALVDNEKGFFAPGQNVRAKILLEILKSVPVVPQKAIKINPQGSYLFVLKSDSTVEMRPVRLGKEQGNQFVVALAGVLPGEKVVTEGHLKLAPGMQVEGHSEPVEPKRRQ